MLRLCFLFLALASVASAEDGFRSLFNGKDLTGWQGDPELWSVEDGCITGTTKGKDHLPYNKFLIWDGTASDFEFRCEFRLEGDNNSGVQYRSVHDKDKGEFVCVGYQADIHAKPEYTGMLYDEKGRGILAQRGQKVVVAADGTKQVAALDGEVTPLDLTQWHQLTIIAKGNHIIHKVDGVVTVEITDNQKEHAELSGVFALQVHRGNAMKAQFRNVQLKDLSENGAQVDGPPAKRKRPAKAAAAKKKKPADAPVAQWIWLNRDDKPESTVYFRKELDSSGVGAARLVAVCDDHMKIFVDGKQVGEGSSWERPVFVELTKHLDLDDPQKKHVLAIEASNGNGSAGFLAELNLESGWRDAWSIVTDDSWQASTQAQDGWMTRDFKPGESWTKPVVVAALGAGPWAKKIDAAALAAAAPLKEPEATPIDQLKVAKGFNVELLYSVPKDEQGSWVNMCVDPKGRLIVSDQYGSLYRVIPPGILGATELSVEKINVDIGEAQGLLWAFDSLYVSVNKGQKYDGGLYRVRDTDGDDQLDSVETLRALNGSGEHGPHAVLPHPDGKNLVIVCGNRTDLTKIDGSRVASWDEDLLLPRVYGKFMLGTRAPGGVMYKIDPDGKTWEVLASGFRNQFDAAFDKEGELFTYDADMEWDINAPWYRPTRICHVVSGADFGWRSTGGKWPVYYPDSVGPVVNVGPGSPTGVCFGYGAKFPQKYQDALFACDWSYGKLYACHLTPDGGTFTGQLEEFITGTPLPLTDVVINSHDGAMYFAIGGRKVQSGLYRVTHDGSPSEGSDIDSAEGAVAREERRHLEQYHTRTDAPLNEFWSALGSADRSLRYAARVALEHQPVASWRDRVLTESNVDARLTGLLALARSYERVNKGKEPDIDSPIPNWNNPQLDSERHAMTRRILESLGSIDLQGLNEEQKLLVLRVLTLTFVRVSPPDLEERARLLEHLESLLPQESQPLNSEIAQLMVYLQAPYAAAKLVPMLEAAPTQEEQIDYARTLRHQTVGWTPDLQERYFKWFTRAASYEGGSSFKLFVDNIKGGAVSRLNDEEMARLKPILDAKPEGNTPVFSAVPRKFVKEWTMEELVPLIQNGLTGRSFEHGRQMFGAASCFACHRFDHQGGSVGPDLTILSGRFSPRDILESVLEPSKQISDQYGSVQIVTTDGKVINGRIINLAGDSFRVQTDMLKPGELTGVDRKQIEEIVESKISMMPKGLLNTLNQEEVLDLMAYLLSRGDRKHAMFSK
ncbi:MAG: family 16 glycoside hydrolase [Planctomycetaceae bacterium]